MASPVVEEAIESSLNTAGTTHTINMPTKTAGQLLVIILDKGSTAATMSQASGWTVTELLDENSGNGLYIAYRQMDGTESGTTVVLTASGSTRSAAIAYRISGAADPAIQPPVIATTGTGTSATPDPPASATPTGSKDFLVIAFAGMAGEELDDDTWGNTPPTNYTPSPPRQKSCGTAGVNLGGLILSAERAITTGSAENPGTFGVDVSAAWRSQTILVYPTLPSINAAPGSYSVADGASATRILADRPFNAALGTYALAGSDAGVPAGRMLDATAGAYSSSGAAAGLLADRTLAALLGTYATTGSDVNLGREFGFDAQPGTYLLAGADAGVIVGRSLEAVPGAYAVSGTVAGLLVDRVIAAVSGAYSVSGAAASLAAERSLDATAGAYVVSGVDAGVLVAHVLAADPGAYVIVGDAATIVAGRSLDAAPGVYLLTGADADLAILVVGAYTLVAAAGDYALTGLAAGLEAGRILPAEPAAYLLVGLDAEAEAARILDAAPAGYLVAGIAANLNFVGTEVTDFPVSRAPVIVTAGAGRLATAETGRILTPDALRLEAE